MLVQLLKASLSRWAAVGPERPFTSGAPVKWVHSDSSRLFSDGRDTSSATPGEHKAASSIPTCHATYHTSSAAAVLINFQAVIKLILNKRLTFMYISHASLHTTHTTGGGDMYR